MSLPILITPFSAIIAAGQSLSAPIAIGYDTLAAISMPAVWTAAALTFQASPDGGVTWQELYNDAGVEVTVTAAAGRTAIFANHAEWAPINMMKVRSGSAAAPVIQAAGATLTLITGDFQF